MDACLLLNLAGSDCNHLSIRRKGVRLVWQRSSACHVAEVRVGVDILTQEGDLFDTLVSHALHLQDCKHQ